MKYVEGNLITMANNDEFDIIIHGCNCFNSMGGGIAAQIAKHFPDAEFIDKCTPQCNIKKLGKISWCVVDDVIVVNGYTQFSPGADYNYDAIRSVFREVKIMFGWKNYRFGIPKIGAGIAGGDWDVISDIIDEEMKGEDLTTVIYAG